MAAFGADRVIPRAVIEQHRFAQPCPGGNDSNIAPLRHGGRTIAVSCWNQAEQTSYTYRRTDGIDLDQLLEITDRFGEIDKEKAPDLGFEVLPGEGLDFVIVKPESLMI